MRDQGDHYKQIYFVVDDILIFSKNTYLITNSLEDIRKYDFKGVGETEYYSRYDVGFDEEQRCCTMSAKTYIKNFCDRIEKITKSTLKNYGLPIDAVNYPEMGDSKLL